MEIQKLETEIVDVDDPNKYTLELLPDGKVRIRADCNLGGGTYALDGNKLSIKITHTTLAACPPGSLYDQYIRNLHEVHSYVLKGNNRYLSMRMDSGILKFAK